MIFVWSPRDPQDPAAFGRFSAILEAQRAWYADRFGHAFHLELQRLDSTYVGQIHFDRGVSGWRPGARTEDAGFVWGGICEDFLGITPDAAAIRDVVERAENDPRTIGEWDGRFVLCTWNRATQRVVVTPGATPGTTLWHTEGPHGWAIGSRAAPILKMTGREMRMDAEVLGSYTAFGYLCGDRAMFAGVRRLPLRTQVTFGRGRAPVFHRYLSLSDYLSPDPAPKTWDDRIALAAERFTTRIRRQLRHSPQPVLLVSGGYDSRCIAAASLLAGYAGSAYTSGAPETPDRVIAARVTKALGIPHVTSQGNVVRGLETLIGSRERLGEWARCTEGMDVIRQAMPYSGFFTGQLPFPRTRRQLFHGMDGVVVRGSRLLHRPGATEVRTPQQHQAVIRQGLPAYLKLRRPIDEAVVWAVAEVREEVPLDATPGQLFTLNGLLHYVPHWGADGMAVRDLIDWHWTPYMDRSLIRMAWSQTDEDRISNRFLVDLAVALAPALAGIEYAAGGDAPPRGILGRWRQSRRAAAYRRVWKDLLLRDPPRVWDQVIEPPALAKLIADEPFAEPLWCLATAELVATAFDVRPPEAPPGSSEVIGAA